MQVCSKQRPVPVSELGEENRRIFWGREFDEADDSEEGIGEGTPNFPLTRDAGARLPSFVALSVTFHVRRRARLAPDAMRRCGLCSSVTAFSRGLLFNSWLAVLVHMRRCSCRVAFSP